VLVAMPFAPLQTPSLGLGLLHAALARKSVSVKTVYSRCGLNRQPWDRDRCAGAAWVSIENFLADQNALGGIGILDVQVLDVGCHSNSLRPRSKPVKHSRRRPVMPYRQEEANPQ
jgi:hypothetical protein